MAGAPLYIALTGELPEGTHKVAQNSSASTSVGVMASMASLRAARWACGCSRGLLKPLIFCWGKLTTRPTRPRSNLGDPLNGNKWRLHTRKAGRMRRTCASSLAPPTTTGHRRRHLGRGRATPRSFSTEPLSEARARGELKTIVAKRRSLLTPAATRRWPRSWPNFEFSSRRRSRRGARVRARRRRARRPRRRTRGSSARRGARSAGGGRGARGAEDAAETLRAAGRGGGGAAQALPAEAGLRRRQGE